MSVQLTNCETITSDMYCAFTELWPSTFKGQTRAKDGVYYTCWEINGRLYKIKNYQ